MIKSSDQIEMVKSLDFDETPPLSADKTQNQMERNDDDLVDLSASSLDMREYSSNRRSNKKGRTVG